MIRIHNNLESYKHVEFEVVIVKFLNYPFDFEASNKLNSGIDYVK